MVVKRVWQRAPRYSSYSQRYFFYTCQRWERVLRTHNPGLTGMLDRWGLPLGTASLPSPALRSNPLLRGNWRSIGDYPNAFAHQPLWHNGQLPGVLKWFFGHFKWMASCRDNRSRAGEKRWMIAASSVTERCWRLVAMMGAELALSLSGHLHHHSGDWAAIDRERTTQAEKAGHPRHCPAMRQFSCNVWHSMLCLADSHLCLLSLELPKHLLSFCSSTSAWSPWHHSSRAFCMMPSAARCSHARWLRGC